MSTVAAKACNKIPFDTEAEAMRRLVELALKARRREGLPIRCYLCPGCGLWHLTRRSR
jgi:hypothetical protein